MTWLNHDSVNLKWVLFYFFILLFTLNSQLTVVSKICSFNSFRLHLITLPYVVYLISEFCYLQIFFIFRYRKLKSIWKIKHRGQLCFWFTLHLFASNSHIMWEGTWLVVRLNRLRPLSVWVVFDKVTRCPVTTCQDKQQAGQCSPRTHGPLQYQEYGL